MTLQLFVNHQVRTVDASPEELVLDVLREDLRLTGTKFGCREGVCGCCTILIDDEAARSCQLTLADVEGRGLTTIEGLSRGEALTPVQQAFVDTQASQCGWCLPALVVVTTALLHRHPTPTEADIEAALDRVHCRCGIYGRIREAIRRAADLTEQAA